MGGCNRPDKYGRAAVWASLLGCVILIAGVLGVGYGLAMLINSGGGVIHERTENQ